jgi:hypothetical protein
MRKVVDSNFLQCEKLRAYLSASTDNYVVLTEYVAMEAYKGDTLKSIYRSLELLAQYPKQVIVLKGTQIVCGLTGRDAASQEPLIDETQSREFSEYCHHLLAAERGDQSLQRQLLEHGREATANMERLLQDMPSLSSGFDLMAKTYSPAELKVLRRRENYTPQMREKLVQNVLLLAAQLFKDHPGERTWPKGPEIRDTFIFRYALCTYVLFLKGVKGGGPAQTNRAELRNDMIDVNFSTFATYFDGLLTVDKTAGEIYAGAEFLLREVFAMPPAWLGWLLQRRWLSRCLSFFGKF